MQPFALVFFPTSWQIKYIYIYIQREHVYTCSQRDKGNRMSSGDKLAVLNKQANPFAAENSSGRAQVRKKTESEKAWFASVFA